VVWVYQTPFSNALAALYFKLAYRSKLVFMYADLWPESFLAANVVRNRALIAVCHYYRKAVNRMADVIIGSTQGTCDKITQEIRNAAPCKLIPVWVEGIPDELPPVVSCRQNEIVYAGNLGKAQALGTVIKGARILAQSHPQLKFTFMGAGTEEDRLRQIVESESLKNVCFVGRQSASIAFDALARAKAQIVILEKSDLFNFTVPSKLFMSLAVGTPILAGLQGEALRLATNTGAAIPFDSDSPSSFADAVKILYDKTPAEREKMANLARISYQNNFIPIETSGRLCFFRFFICFISRI
jgi:glycosyltransferase involved in cell wall biosynthesis